MFRRPVAIATSLLLLTVPLRPESALAQHGGGGHGGGHLGGGFRGRGAHGVIGDGNHRGAGLSGSGVRYRGRLQQFEGPAGSAAFRGSAPTGADSPTGSPASVFGMGSVLESLRAHFRLQRVERLRVSILRWRPSGGGSG